LVQEVFLKVYRGLHHFDGRSSLNTWIYRIAVNEAHDMRRRRSRRGHGEVPLDADSAEARFRKGRLADYGPSPFDLLARRECPMRLSTALEILNPCYRTAVLLRAVEDLSHQEIAKRLRVTFAIAKYRIFRGRRRLRLAATNRGGHPLCDSSLVASCAELQ
jgi:RNA polymerase sigma-70 factor (ECF subfamily)